MSTSTRSKTSESERDEVLIQKIVENILTNKSFLDKIVDLVNQGLQQKLKDLHKTVQDTEAKLSSMETKLSSMQTAHQKLEDEMECAEQYSRMSNLRIYGVPEEPSEQVEAIVTDICINKLGVKISAADIDTAHRLGAREGNHKPIIVKFARRSAREEIYSNKRKLKNSSIVIREDLTGKKAAAVRNLVDKVGSRSVFTSRCTIFVHVHVHMCTILKINYAKLNV